ncbi:MAG TPA: rhodanese-like domain-containing protein [Gaiellaceae bacterium]
MARKSIDESYEEAARRLGRVTAVEAYAEMRAGAVLVDTRSPDQQRAQGFVPGAVHHPLSVLAWRLDPDVPTSNEKLALDARILLICREGYSSVFAAEQLKEIGFTNATDVIGGVDAWKAAGLPILGQADPIALDANQAVAS